MQWVVYGAGAVGGVLGGLLRRAGQDVVLVARGDHLAAIRANGLEIVTPTGSTIDPVPAVAGAGEIDWSAGSVVLLAVKSHQTATALDDLTTFAPPETPVVCVQNGVANETAALRVFANVYAVCVMMPAAHLEPGVVEVHSSPTPGILDVGRFPGGADELSAHIVSAFTSAGFVSEPRADIMAWKHRKLVMNLGNAVQACCASGLAATELDARVRSEGEAVLAAAGVRVVSEEEDRRRRGDILRSGDASATARTGGSSWQSLRRATGNVESDYLNGEVVLLGRLHGVPVPANELLQRTAARMGRDRAEPGTLDAATLLSELSGSHPARAG
jgi:2-dehydropantoate 2-reductase